jgi:hypothetical protein
MRINSISIRSASLKTEIADRKKTPSRVRSFPGTLWLIHAHPFSLPRVSESPGTSPERSPVGFYILWTLVKFQDRVTGRSWQLLNRQPSLVLLLVVGLKYLIAAALFATGCFGQDTEIGGAIGYGVYRNGSIYAPGGKAQTGIRNQLWPA